MSLAHVITSATCLTEIVLAALAVIAMGTAVRSYCSDEMVDGTVLVGLAVIGVFALIALDTARRGAGL